MSLVRESKAVYSTADGLPIMEVGSWAEKKYSLVRLYTELFATGMKKKWQHRVYVDLFSGPGKVKVRDNETILLGSPLLALDIPDKFNHYVFCDQSQTHIEALQQRVARGHPEIRPAFIHGDCNKTVNQVLGHIPPRKALTLCLLDPFNLGIEFTTVRTLSQHPVDFLMSLMLGVDALRNSKRYIDKNSPRIARFLGRTDWRTQWKEENKKGKSFPRFLAEEFVRKMIGLGYRNEALTTMVEVRSGENNLWLYHLAFFSRHERGYDFWAKGKKYATDQLSFEL